MSHVSCSLVQQPSTQWPGGLNLAWGVPKFQNGFLKRIVRTLQSAVQEEYVIRGDVASASSPLAAHGN